MKKAEMTDKAARDRGRLLERFEIVDMASKVVGVGSASCTDSG
jgi:hypothetical protein